MVGIYFSFIRALKLSKPHIKHTSSEHTDLESPEIQCGAGYIFMLVLKMHDCLGNNKSVDGPLFITVF